MITKENYEIYFTDYMDGKLPPSTAGELKTFLLLHPDLEEIFEGMNEIRLKPATVQFSRKSELKKEDIHECTDYYAIAASEGTLTEKDKQAIRLRAENKEFQSLVNIYGQLQLRPDPAIRFEHKGRLYRKSLKYQWLLKGAAAAAILLIITAAVILLRYPQQTELLVAETIPLQQEIPATPEWTLKPMGSLKTAPQPIKQKQISKQTTTIAIRVETVEKTDVMKIIPQPMNKMICNLATNSYEQLQPSENISIPEIQLCTNAEKWKSSEGSFQSRDIFTSFVSAGKDIAERIKNKEFDF